MKHYSQAALLFAFALCLGLSVLKAEAQTYYVSVNTSSLSGTTGYVDVTYLAGNGSALDSTATVSLFSTNGALAYTGPAAPALSGTTTGLLSSSVAEDNSGGYNDYNQGITYGSTMTFKVVFTGAGVTSAGPYGTDFAFSLYGADDATSLLSTSADGTLADIGVNGPGGFTTASNSPTTIISLTPPAIVPEPNPFLIMTFGVLAVGGLVSLKRKRRTTDTQLPAAVGITA